MLAMDMSYLIFVLVAVLIAESQATVGERKRIFTSRSEGTVTGHYLFLVDTAYTSNTPPFLTTTTNSELACKCTCSANRQCLSVTYRSTDALCSLYANDPCDTRNWQRNSNMNFYINIKRLKYRIFEKPERGQPLRRVPASSLCGGMNAFNAERRWMFVVKLGGQSKVNFDGLNFNTAPNQVAPSPWHTSSMENIWNSILMHQWNSHAYFPKYFGLALIYNGAVREFVYFRLHKTTVENFFNRQHTPVAFCWNLKPTEAHLHHTLDRSGHFKRIFSISINGNTSHTMPCDRHETFMYIKPLGQVDRCAEDDPYGSVRIMFSNKCHPMPYSQLLRADALIGLTTGDTTTDT